MRSVISRRLGAFGQALAFLALVSCGGGGGGGSSTPPAPASKVFFADGGNGAIVSFSNATPTAAFPIDRVINGAHTGLPAQDVFSIPSLTLDAANNRLYVATQGNTFIFNSINTADGDVAPSVTMSAQINTTGTIHGVNFMHNDLNRGNGTLYSVDIFGEVHVFANPIAAPSTVSRIITPDLGTTTVVGSFGLALDAGKDMLYAGVVFNGTGSSNIIVFNNASTIGTVPLAGFPPPQTTVTPVAPSRTLSFAQAIGSFYLDTANDRLYVSQSDGHVLVFDNASTIATGTPTADRNIDLGATFQFYIFVDSGRNKLYAVTSNTPAAIGGLAIIDNANAATGLAPGHFFTFSPIAKIALSAIVVAP